MYVSPELTELGDAREVVLGLVNQGFDLDGTMVVGDLEGIPEYPFPIGE